jgi:hypothetical protein
LTRDRNQIVVSSPSAPDEFVLMDSDPPGATRIRIGDPDITITGVHRYQIDYPIEVNDDPQTFFWNGVGTRWLHPLNNIEVHLLSAYELENPSCSSGTFGSWGGCTAEQVAPGHLVVRVDQLDAGEGVTVSGTYGDALDAAPSRPVAPSTIEVDDDNEALPLIPLAAGIPTLLAMGVMARRVRRLGREAVWAGGSADAAYGPVHDETYPVRFVDGARLADMASTEFTPPKGLQPWQGGVLHVEDTGVDHQVAWLLEMANAGHLEITTSEEGWLVFAKSVVTLRRTSFSPGPPLEDSRILDQMFGGRESISLGSYDRQFAAGWEALGERQTSWLNESPFWDPTGDRRRARYRGWGIAAWLVGGLLALGTVVAAVVFSPWVLVATAVVVAVAAGGWAAMVTAGELRVRTPEGSGQWILVESFRRFVEKSEAQHVEAAAAEGRLREYTAWATALGEAEHWSEAVGQADLRPDEAAQAVYFAGLGHHLHTATAAAATQPSSSGGGGGGGFSGGGGGGGGGGSW